MKISVITVCLNSKDTIEDTFLSVFNQSYEDFELIVIDGGSQDGTLEIVKKYKDKISYFVSETDKGIYDAMNKGIKMAGGDFIFFLNANDTFYDNQVLQKVTKALKENLETKFLFGDTNYISKDKLSSQVKTYQNIKTQFSLIFDNICHQSIFYHKSLFEAFGSYSDEFEIYADWDFNIKCLVEKKVSALYLPISIANFQLGGICSSLINKSKCIREKKVLIRKHYYKYRFPLFLCDFIRRKFRFVYIFKGGFELNIKLIRE